MKNLNAVFVILLAIASCSLFRPQRAAGQEPDSFELKAAAVTLGIGNMSSHVDCTTERDPNLAAFCKADCKAITHADLKANCELKCDDIKDANYKAFCKAHLEFRPRSAPHLSDREKTCGPILSFDLRSICEQMADLQQQRWRKAKYGDEGDQESCKPNGAEKLGADSCCSGMNKRVGDKIVCCGQAGDGCS